MEDKIGVMQGDTSPTKDADAKDAAVQVPSRPEGAPGAPGGQRDSRQNGFQPWYPPTSTAPPATRYEHGHAAQGLAAAVTAAVATAPPATRYNPGAGPSAGPGATVSGIVRHAAAAATPTTTTSTGTSTTSTGTSTGGGGGGGGGGGELALRETHGSDGGDS